MNVVEMRKYVAGKYYSDTWTRKVKNMSDNQITAIYHRMQLDDKNAAYIIRDRHQYGR